MSGFTPFGGGSSAPVNPNTTYEPVGFEADGSGVLVTAGTQPNLGTAVTIGTTAADWVGFTLWLGTHSGATNRFMVDLSWDGFSTTHVANVFYADTTTSMCGYIDIPLQVPSGSQIQAKLRSNATSATCDVAVVGWVENATTPPGFTTFTSLNADTANVRPSSVNVPMQAAVGSWTELVANPAAYGALIAIVGGNGTQWTNIQNFTVILAMGDNPGEAAFYRMRSAGGTGLVSVSRGISSPIYFGTTLNAALSAQCVSSSTITAENARIGLYGLA